MVVSKGERIFKIG